MNNSVNVDPCAQHNQPVCERCCPVGYTLITGATGLVGNVLLAELLKDGHRCLVLMRRPIRDRLRRLIELLEAQGVDGSALRVDGNLCALEGSLPDDLPASFEDRISRVVHIAASTRFRSDSDGEPARTNDDGTHQLLRWMDRHDIKEIHHVSTAYVFGNTPHHTPERVSTQPAQFRNAYERSKWQAECHIAHWGETPGHGWTIYRPSIVVGDWRTGRATRFAGAYQVLQVFDLLSQSIRADPDQPIPLRIESHPDGNLNLIPVDYLAELMAAIINHTQWHGRVYNIVHPRALLTQSFLEFVKRYFGLTGVHITDPGTIHRHCRTQLERVFYAATCHISPYLREISSFDRSNTADAESMLTRTCPSWDEMAIHRLIEYARHQNWGRSA